MPKMRQISLAWLAYLQTEAGAADSKRILRLLFVNIFDIASEPLVPLVEGLFPVTLCIQNLVKLLGQRRHGGEEQVGAAFEQCALGQRTCIDGYCKDAGPYGRLYT